MDNDLGAFGGSGGGGGGGKEFGRSEAHAIIEGDTRIVNSGGLDSNTTLLLAGIAAAFLLGLAALFLRK